MEATASTNRAPKGTILQILRMSTEDGPGIRTSVFFKGCPIRCAWCHNPESISRKPQTQWIGSRCIDCGFCVKACRTEALSRGDKGILIDRSKCRGCGECADECPSTAMELLGKSWTVDALVDEVLKDRAYFEKSDGGITATGGEPTLQAAFVAEFIARLRRSGVHTALDTCGQCSTESLDMILPGCDMVMFDLKLIDPGLHKRLTGVSNERIHDSLRHVAERMRQSGEPKELWIRTPIIPDATDHEENIASIGRFIAENLDGLVSRWDLCSFNNLCRDKYVRLDINWAYRNKELMTRERMEALAEVGRGAVADPEIVKWSGATRIDPSDTAADAGESRPRQIKTCP